ncbi:cation:proton antiporter [Uliginosibacterium gangwonense]|uniref:cation:proton antiporter n=1 Tax=Uliginosibacterium gangwonense TaxID=392736 RepID=UPI00037EB627|nr:sodium:proton antiporter [Uliginosibacterium gangwonense]
MSAIEVAKTDLFYAGVVMLTGVACSIVAKRLRVPDIVLYLLAGMALGPALFGVVHVPADGTLNQLILTFGASYLLFDGGASLRFKVLKEVWITIVIISTLGVLVTGAITASAAWAFGIPAMTALLLGAAIASTDPATLVPIFKQVPIKDRVAQTVMSESAFNDAMGAIATFSVLGLVMGSGEGFSIGASLKELLWQAGLGIVIGGVAGYAACVLIAHEKFGFMREHLPLVTLMAVIGAYLTADGMQSSGFMAVFVFGIMIGNKESFGFALEDHEQENLEDFIGTTTLIMRMFIFILLGSQVDFALLKTCWQAGLATVLVFMFIARPLTVFICAGVDRRAKWSLRELLFMSWTRETGVIPAALAGMLVGMKVPGAEVVSAITFIAILMTILIQAPTTEWLAGKLGLLADEAKR